MVGTKACPPYDGIVTIKLPQAQPTKKNRMAKKKNTMDAEIMAIIEWCVEVEGHFITAGATQEEAQEQIEENIEWFTEMFFDGLTPKQAAKEALSDPE